jgi:hypothetical protein
LIGYFQNKVSWAVCLGWPQTSILLSSACQVARITGVSHWCLAHLYFFIWNCLFNSFDCLLIFNIFISMYDGVSLSHLHICLQCTLVRFIASIILPYPPSLLLKTISTSFIVLFFLQMYKVHQPHSPLFSPSPFTFPVPLIPLQKGSVFTPVFHFQVYIPCSKGFHHGISTNYIVL